MIHLQSIDRSVRRLALAAFLGVLSPAGAIAQDSGDAREPEWRNTTELSYLLNGGNAVSSTLGLRNSLRRESDTDEMRADVTVRRTDATRITREAVGTSPDAYEIVEERDRERTAERYHVEARYDHDLSEETFAFVGTGWERNEIAGFRHRTVAVVGGGGQWKADDESWEAKLGAGVTYTVRRDVVPDPSRDDAFGGLRGTFDYLNALTDDTELELKWVVDANAEEFSGVRGDLMQAVSASLTDRLALKTTLQLLLDNDPPLEAIPLVAPDGTQTGEEVREPLGKLDHSLSIALVITM